MTDRNCQRRFGARNDLGYLYGGAIRALRSRQPEEAGALIAELLDSPNLGRSVVARLHELLGIARSRSGMPNCAIKHWVAAAKLKKRGNARKRLRHRTNDYAMARQSSSTEDDRNAFYGIQLARYIRSKRSHKLGTLAEGDMVHELIEEYWLRIERSGVLDRLSSRKKRLLFEETLIVFPFLSVPESLKVDDIAVDFAHKRRVDPADRCPCGSSLAFSYCCGRIPGIDELEKGEM